ncbi:hypothetical protein GCM10010371_40670 [Streptomyces subrutilus]|uniref:Uncharacterized protein n=1 Tax=Streptomyces subrutilus TaxID=36818 RepID=A0A5P2UIJ3_9ACTN|nr:hypothetical protein [Streptomyces subrutilus]QEU79063.1 hypothetical protein CP968_12795 [Streptomyces subrutilus]GGZ76798.1 hypothetical protein GCM10010371_40670 [Streptomyces subrutilus]
MATSRVLGYLESKKNLAGSACGVAGVALALAGSAGPYWPAVVAGLYGAGALIAPPERVAPPRYPDAAERLGAVREDLGRLRAYVARAELPPTAAGTLAGLLERYAALLDPGWAADVLGAEPEAVHVLSRAIRADVPECVDAYHRTRWWTRITPGGASPERELERQLAALYEEAEGVAAALREAEARRQRTHTTYLEDRGRS